MGSASSSMSARPLSRDLPADPSPINPSDSRTYTAGPDMTASSSTSAGPSVYQRAMSSVSRYTGGGGGSSSSNRAISTHTRFVSPPPVVPRHQSVNSTLGLPMSRVAIRSEGDDDREEGEISSDGEDVMGGHEGDVGHLREQQGRGSGSRNGTRMVGSGQGLYEHYSPPGGNRPLKGGEGSGRRDPRGGGPAPGRASENRGRGSGVPSSAAPVTRPQATASSSRPIVDADARSRGSIIASSSSSETAVPDEEARKYMDIIHKLLKDGQSPDVLIRQGANAKYVTAVCEEIVQGTRRRKEVSLEEKPAIATSSAVQPPTASQIASGSKAKPIIGSPESDIQVIVSTDRRMSMSSEGSAEFMLIEPPSPPRPKPARIVPSLSWTPAPTPPPVVPKLEVTPSPAQQSIRVDRYTPSQPAESFPIASTPVDSFVPGAISASSSINPPSRHSVTSSVPANAPQVGRVPMPLPSSLPPKPLLSQNADAGPSRLPMDVPTGPRQVPTKRAKRNKKKRFEDETMEQVQTLNYDDEAPAVQPLDRPESSATPVSIKSPTRPNYDFDITPVLPVARTPVPHFLPTPATMAMLGPGAGYTAQPIDLSSAAQVEIRAKSDMLEIRRRALASMKLRKAKKNSPEKVATDLPTTSESTVEAPTSASVKTIEQEVLDLEQEVLGLQAQANANSTSRDDSPMELDSPGPGDAPTPTLIANTPSSLPLPPVFPTSSSLPARRGIKRPNAEDLMDSRPTVSSAPGRLKRKAFGGFPQRPGRLLVNLDDHSDSDSDTDEAAIMTPPIVVKNVMVEDKEAQIRALRAKIAAVQAEKQRKKALAAAGIAGDSGTGSPAAESPVPAPAVIQPSVEEAAAVQALKQADEDLAAIKDNAMSAVQAGSGQANAAAETHTALDKAATGTVAASLDNTEADMDLDESEAESPAEDAVQAIETDEDLAAIEVRSSRYPTPADDDDVVAIPAPSPPAQAPTYQAYTPLLGRYPQLSATSHSTPSFSQYNKIPSRPLRLSDIFIKLDRTLLSSIMLTHRIARNPGMVICSAEVGGGICADAKCPYLHLDKDEPTGEDWTEYTYQVMSRVRDVQPERKLVQKAVATALGKQFAKGKGIAQSALSFGKGAKSASVQKALEIVLAGIGISVGEAEKAQAKAAQATASAGLRK